MTNEKIRKELIDYLYENVHPTNLTIEECADDILDIIVKNTVLKIGDKYGQSM